MKLLSRFRFAIKLSQWSTLTQKSLIINYISPINSSQFYTKINKTENLFGFSAKRTKSHKLDKIKPVGFLQKEKPLPQDLQQNKRRKNYLTVTTNLHPKHWFGTLLRIKWMLLFHIDSFSNF